MPANSNYIALDPFTRAAVSNIPLSGGSASFDPNQVTPANATSSVFSGDIHISATLPTGFVYGNLTSVSLSDGTNSLKGPGDANNLLTGSTIWSDNSSFGAYSLFRQASSNSSTSFDIYVPPVRNEAGACMTLTMVLNNQTYFTQFGGQAVDVTKYNKTNGSAWYNNNTSVLLLYPYSGSSAYVCYTESNVTHVASLASLLSSSAYDHFYLNTGNYTIDYNSNSTTALSIDRPLWLDGATSAKLFITANSLANTTSLIPYESALKITSNHVLLSNFSLSFANPVYFSSGTAISINTGRNSPSQHIVDVTLS